MKLRNKAQSGYYKEYVKHSHEDLTIREIWEKTGKLGSLSNAYYVIKTNQLPYKNAPKGRTHKHDETLSKLDTANMTIRQIMAELGLSKTADYYRILKHLNAQELPYKRAKFTSKFERKLRSLDTANMTIKEIAEQLGIYKIGQEWRADKLYTILPKMGLPYKKLK
jgi:transposase